MKGQVYSTTTYTRHFHQIVPSFMQKLGQTQNLSDLLFELLTLQNGPERWRLPFFDIDELGKTEALTCLPTISNAV